VKDVKGVVIGLVREIDAAAGRVKLSFPWLGKEMSDWAPIAVLMAGRERGTYYMPEIDDEALVAFLHGEFAHPYVIGFLWNGKDLPPTNERRLRLIHSVNGHEIAIYDPQPAAGDKGFIRIRDAHGNTIELANGRISIRALGMLELKAPSVTINGRLVSPVGPPI
jgi:uncharacterized protein involved in type VI secretion and phage assembly